ncbi:MAG: YicC family protein [Candidatus Omnitrophica bacterium]|nr:YicC family protein [Candidatus Omnitrophota bacterium]MBI3021085.1 YicC family protein [Candidatus Omnitrophota bacterium]
MSSTRQGAIQSMTGYGRAVKRTAIGSVTVELRSTNHRYLEIEQHLPSSLTALQGRLAELIRSHVRRGRIEAFVNVQLGSEHQRVVTFDEPLLQRYHAALVELNGRFGLKDHVRLDHLLSLPQALTITEDRTPPERLWEPIREAVQAAVRELVRARWREGATLTADLRRQIRSMERHLGAIKRRLPKALAEQRRRLRERLRELLGSGATVSTGQLEQTVALVKEADVHEELVRLESHLTYMRQTLASHQLVGKRLDFIAQELIREANTMGAKVNDPVAVQHVVDLKGCIEKIREQVQNLE